MLNFLNGDVGEHTPDVGEPAPNPERLHGDGKP